MSSRKQTVREFYEQLIEDTGCGIDGFEHFLPEARIGRVELTITGDWGEYGCEAICDSVEIEHISAAVPQEVVEAFDRHLWFAQHGWSNVFVFKIPVEGEDTYALGITGVSDDGYDNSGIFIEVFSAVGELIGAAMLSEGEKPEWSDDALHHSVTYAGTLKWEDTLTQSSYRLWSTELAVRTEQQGSVTRLVLLEPE